MKNKGFTLIELMIVVAIAVIAVAAVYASTTNGGGMPVVTTNQNYESPFATHAIASEGETTKVNLHRNLKGAPYWIETLRCNENDPTEQNQLQCFATLRHQTERNVEENVQVLCDQARSECDSDDDCTAHESTGCVLSGPLTQNEP